MKNQQLKEAVAAMLSTHPLVEPSIAGHNEHAKRFVTVAGAHIGWQDELKTQQNLYVQRDSINLARLVDIPHKIHLSHDFASSMPNHDLFHADSFTKDRDVVAFKVTEVWQAVRVVAEVAGLAA